jgi:hypothetical protein
MKKTLVAAMALLALSGCASIFNGKTQSITLNSVPPGANVSVTNRAGEKIHTGTTPVTVTLNRGAGYFKSETYVVSLAKEGFAPQEVTLSSAVSGWYIGNILFGGLIGMLAVDPVSGAMYTFPDSVTGTLVPKTGKVSQSNDSLTIVSTETLTPAQMALARPLSASSTN